MDTRTTSNLDALAAAIGQLPPKLRGALVEELVNELSSARPEPGTRKASIIDTIVMQALAETPLSTRVRTSNKVARATRILPQSARVLASDVIGVAEVVLLAPDMDDGLLAEVCATDRQDHMRVITKRSPLSTILADTIAELGDNGTVLMLVSNLGARLSKAGFETIAARLGSDPSIAAAISQRGDAPQTLPRFARPTREEQLSPEELAHVVTKLSDEGRVQEAVDHLMRAIGRDQEGGRLILERGDEKALGAVCHVAGVEASVYEAVVVSFRKATGRSMDDVRKAPVRFRLMRPAEIDRIVTRLPMRRARQPA